jgi:signal-transduction protein with cAMP-binding, CBS, and nucleotidyltransferase domain
MAYNSAKEECSNLIEQLDDMESRLLGDCFNRSDILNLIKINKELVYKAFERDIDQEIAEELHEEIMSEMDPFDM